MPKQLLRSILLTTLIAGLADIGLAFAQAYLKNNVMPESVLRFIASALFGREAFTGGAIMIYVGLFLHFVIVLIFTTAFYFLYKKVDWIARHTWISGCLYGIAIWCVMNLIILPMSKVPAFPFSWNGMLTGMLILVLAIGIPVALRADKFYKGK